MVVLLKFYSNHVLLSYLLYLVLISCFLPSLWVSGQALIFPQTGAVLPPATAVLPKVTPEPSMNNNAFSTIILPNAIVSPSQVQPQMTPSDTATPNLPLAPSNTAVTPSPPIFTMNPPPSQIQSVNPPTSTPNSVKPSTPTNPCSSGVCNVPNRGTCISLENTGICSAFANMYLPTKLNAYFAARFPNRDSNQIPTMQNGEMFNNLFGDKSYSYMGKYIDEYSVGISGCSSPNQRWLITWFCIDILQFYANANDPCSANLKPSICSSTLNSRADSVQADLDNREICLIPSEAKAKGQQYLNYLRAFPWASSNPIDSTCISGELNENGPNSYRKCGWYSELTACKNEASCPKMDKTLQAKCPSIISAAQTAMPGSSTPPDSTNASFIVSISVAVLALLCLLVGLRSLSNLRKNADMNNKAQQQSADAEKRPDRLTITSTPANVTESVILTPVASPFVSTSLRPVSLVESTRSSVVNSYLASPNLQSVVLTQSPVFVAQSSEVSTPLPSTSTPNHPVSMASLDPSVPISTQASLMSPNPTQVSVPVSPPSPTKSSSSPLDSPATITPSFRLRQPDHLSSSFCSSSSLPSSPLAAFPPLTQPTKRPPNSRPHLPPVLSPVPPTPSVSGSP